MTATSDILKALPLQKSTLASRQAWRTQKGLLSTSATRNLQRKSAHTRSGVSASATGKPPVTSPSNQHETEPADSPDVRPRAISNNRKLPANYNATARRVLTIMVGLPIFIVTSYVLFERVFLGKERKILAPRSETEKPSLANGDIPQDPPISQPDKYQEGETLRRVAS